MSDIFGGGGGGGSAAPNQTTTSYNAVSSYAAPYVEGMLGKAQALTDANMTYQPYGGQRTADFTGLQNQASGAAGNLGVQQQTTDASNMAAQAGLGALNTQYGGQQFGNTYQGLGAYNPGQITQQDVNAPNLNMYQMQDPRNVRTQQFTGNSVGQYMNPYLQNVLDPQLQEIQRQYGITGTQQQGAATQAGAFGGSREAIMAAENERNKNTAMNNAIGQGFNTAYQNAANQFNTSQGQSLQAQQANQQAGLTAGQANLNAALGVQQLGAGQNLQSQLANQQTNLATQQAQQQANQFGYGQAANQAQNAAQYGLAANQLNANQQQFGANLGLQGLQTANQAAGTLGNLGQNQYAQTTGNINLQNQLGTQQQQQQQNVLNQQYQDFLNQKQNPYTQLSYMQSLMSGLPMTSTTQNVYSNPSMLSQVAGLGTAAYGASKLAKGGKVKSRVMGETA
jgi:hypothetical protein